MATKSGTKQFKRALKDVDDIIHLFTGKRLKNIVETGINLFGEDLAKKAAGIFTGTVEPELGDDSPYTILGVRSEALDVVVKGAFRSLAREYHPDTGTKPDPVKFQEAQEAFDAIMKGRQESKEAEKSARN